MGREGDEFVWFVLGAFSVFIVPPLVPLIVCRSLKLAAHVSRVRAYTSARDRRAVGCGVSLPFELPLEVSLVRSQSAAGAGVVLPSGGGTCAMRAPRPVRFTPLLARLLLRSL